MPETLLEKANRLGIVPENNVQGIGGETLLQKAQRLGIKPELQQQQPSADTARLGLGGYLAQSFKGLTREEEKPAGLKGFAADILSPAAGFAGAVRRPIATLKGVQDVEKTEESRRNIIDSANQFIAMAQQEQEPERKKRLLRLANSTLKESEAVKKTSEEIMRETPQSVSTFKDIERIAGQAIGTAGLVAPLAPTGITAGVLSKGFQAAGLGAKAAGKVVSFGKGFIPRAVESAGIGAAIGAGGAMEREEGIKEIGLGTLGGAAFGAALPFAGTALRKILNKPGNFLLRSAMKSYQRTLKPSLAKRNLRKIPEVIETGLREGIVLSERGVQKVADKIDNFENKLGEEIEKAAGKRKEIKTAVLRPFIEEAKKHIKNISDVAYSKRAVRDIDSIYKNFRKEYGTSIPVEVAQDIKTATYRWLKDAYGELSSPVKEANKQLVRGLKEGIVDVAPAVKNINSRLKKLYEFDEALSRASGRIGNLNLLGLGVRTAAITGGVIGGAKGAAILGAIDKLVSSPGAQSQRAIVYYRIGKLLNKLSSAEKIDAFANRPFLRDIYERTTGVRPKGTPPKIKAGLSIEDVSGKQGLLPKARADKLAGSDVVASGSSELNKGAKLFGGLKDLSTKLLEKFRGMPEEITPQQFNEVVNKAQKEGIRKADLDIVNNSLVRSRTGNIDLLKTASKIEEQLVPLTPTPVKSPRWSNIGEEFIGDGKYGEIVYQSPIKTSAGNVHFPAKNIFSGYGGRNYRGKDEFPNYFSHIRYEDLADGKTRKILETQSDLFQKGKLETSIVLPSTPKKLRNLNALKWFVTKGKEKGMGEEEIFGNMKKILPDLITDNKINSSQDLFDLVETAKSEIKISEEIKQLSEYDSNDPLAHLRTFREEVRRAAKDGKDTILIPSGETAMKIEGLGSRETWSVVGGEVGQVNISDLKVNKEIVQHLGMGPGERWIITDVLGDGKFKAVTKANYDSYRFDDLGREVPQEKIVKEIRNFEETFDISGKIDTQHFVYKLNEEAIPREARKMGLRVEGKASVNARGNIIPGSGLSGKGDWWFIRIPKERAKMPVEAFGVAPLFPLMEDGKKE